MQSDVQNLQEIREELKKYASGEMIPSLDEVFRECNAVVTRSILAAFSLPIFADKDGGNVTTIHNFKQGITSNSADMKKYTEYVQKYDSKRDRSKYETEQRKIRQGIIKDTDKPIIDGYTGKELPRDGRAQLEHIVAVGEIERMPENFLFMDAEDRVKLAYNDANLTMTDSRINQSKGDIPLKEWAAKVKSGQDESNATRFGIDMEKAVALDENARAMIRAKQKKAAIHKQVPELAVTGLQQGMALGTREVLAIIFIEFNDEASICIQGLMERYRRGELTIEEIIEESRVALFNIKDRLLEKYKDIFGTFVSGMGSGFFSNLLVFAINNFITTAKHIVMIIREAVYALIHTGKIMCSDKYPSSEAKAQAAAEVLISSTTICLTALLGDAMRKYLSVVPYSEEISQALSAIIVGVSIVLISYYFQSMQAELAATTAAVTQTALTTTDTIETVQQYTKNSEKRMQQMKSQAKKLSSLKF